MHTQLLLPDELGMGPRSGKRSALRWWPGPHTLHLKVGKQAGWNTVQGQKTTHFYGHASEPGFIHPAAVLQLCGVLYLDELLLVIN